MLLTLILTGPNLGNTCASQAVWNSTDARGISNLSNTMLEIRHYI